jgi:hypothetical protein
MALRMPLEMEDLPLPGGPYIRIERPGAHGGAEVVEERLGRIRWPIAAVSWSRVTAMLRMDWRLTCSR